MWCTDGRGNGEVVWASGLGLGSCVCVLVCSMPAGGVHPRLILNYDQVWKMRHRGRKHVLKKGRPKRRRTRKGLVVYRGEETKKKQSIKDRIGSSLQA